MTNEYRGILLEYLTGNLTSTNGTTTPYYHNISKYDTNIYQALGTPDYWLYGGIKSRDGKVEYNNKLIYWGEYLDNGNSKYFLLITDESSKYIAIIKNYSSGTQLSEILALNVAEDGNVYGIDITSGGTFRIILLNNITEIPKGYSTHTAILRNSYNIQGYTVDDDISKNGFTFIQKSPQSATYYFTLSDALKSSLEPSTFKINVGSTNEWTRLQSITLGYDPNILTYDIYFDTDDNPTADYYITEDINGTGRSLTERKAISNNNSTTKVLVNNKFYKLFVFSD